MSKHKTLTTVAGIPVADNQTSLTAGEQIPDRVVHAVQIQT